MKYEQFSDFLDTYRKGQSMVSELYSIGMDFMEGKYSFSDILYHQLGSFMSSHYDQEGVEWVSWFIFENEYGEKDWSFTKTINGEGNSEKHGAFDEKGNPIFYSYESSWEYLEKHHKVND